MGAPTPRQELVDPTGRVRGDAREDIGEPSLRIDVIHLSGDDEAVNGGGAPSTTQAALIERCGWIALRLRMLESKLAAGELSEHDSNFYLAWSNCYSRLLARLGMVDIATKKKSKQEAEFNALLRSVKAMLPRARVEGLPSRNLRADS